MNRHRQRPEQIVRKLREGERLLNEGKVPTEVVRHLEIVDHLEPLAGAVRAA